MHDTEVKVIKSLASTEQALIYAHPNEYAPSRKPKRAVKQTETTKKNSLV